MKKFFNRIGTKATKFQYEAQIQQVNLSVDKPCQIKIIWKRGTHSTQTSRSQQISHRTGQADFQESLFLDGTLYHSKKTNKYQEKISVFVLIMESSTGNKEIGQVQLDLSALPNTEKSSRSYSLKLEKSPYKQATLKFTLICNKLGDVDESQISSDQEGQSQFQSQNLKTTTNNLTKEELEDHHDESFSNERDNSLNDASPDKIDTSFDDETNENEKKIEEDQNIIYEAEDERQSIEQQQEKEFQEKQIEFQQRKEELIRKQKELDEKQHELQQKSEEVKVKDGQKKQVLKFKIKVEKDEKKRQEKLDQLKKDKYHFIQNNPLKKSDKDQQAQPISRNSTKKTITQIHPQTKHTQNQKELQNPHNSLSTPKSKNQRNHSENKQIQNQNEITEQREDQIKDDLSSLQFESQVVDEDQTHNLNTEDNNNHSDNDDNEEQAKHVEKDFFDLQQLSNRNTSDQSTEYSPSDKKYNYVQQRSVDQDFNKLEEGFDFDEFHQNKNIELPEDQNNSQEQTSVQFQFDIQKINELKIENEQFKRIVEDLQEQINEMGNTSLLSIENNQQKAKIQSLNDQIAKLQGEIIFINSTQQQLEIKHKNLVSDHTNLVKENQQNKDILEELQDEKNSQNSSTKAVEHEQKMRLEKITCQQEEINSLRDEQTKQESENFKLQKKIQELELTVNTIKEQTQNENIEKETTIINQKQEIQKIEKQLNEVKEILRNTEEEKQKAINQLTVIELDKRDIQTKLQILQNDFEYSKEKSEGENQDYQKELTNKNNEIENLKQRIQEILNQNNEQIDHEEKKETIIELEKKNQQQQEYINILENNLSEIEQDSKNHQQSQNLIEQLNDELKELKYKFENSNKKLKNEIQNKEKEIEDKKMIITQLQTQIFEMEQANIFQSNNYDQADMKYEELKKQNETIKEECQLEVESLNILISELRNQIQQTEQQQIYNSNSNKSDTNYEIEIARIQVENEQLQRKIKDLNAKVQKLEQNAEVIKAFKRLETDHQTAKDELIQIKMEKVNYDQRLKQNRVLIQDMEIKIKETELTKQRLYKELVQTKQKFGDALNVCLELGGSELVDKILRVES